MPLDFSLNVIPIKIRPCRLELFRKLGLHGINRRRHFDQRFENASNSLLFGDFEVGELFEHGFFDMHHGEAAGL